MNVLNPSLYAALQRAFGVVRVADRGAAMVGQHMLLNDGRKQFQVASAGEYYVVPCFACNDTRFRLWINHRWGVPDPVTGSRNRWAAHCFNENCLEHEEHRRELIELTSWYHRSAADGRVALSPGFLPDVGRRVPLPDDFQLLSELPNGHAARRYVKRRGFEPDNLAAFWGVGYSQDGPFPGRGIGRLVVPLYRTEQGVSKQWGWQARRLDDADRKKKYYIAKGLRKSTILYGAERVKKSFGPVTVCEGVTDVWRFGYDAVALLGKVGSDYQLRQLCRLAHLRAIVVALDGDAVDAAETLAARLRWMRASAVLRPDDSPVVVLRLPEGKDPAALTRAELDAAVHGIAGTHARSRRKTCT